MQDSSSPSSPQITVLIENPRKSTNWGPLLRCCTAFGITQIFVIGYDTCSVQGSHGASKHVELVAFHSHDAAAQTIHELGFTIVGLLQGAGEAFTTHDVHCVTRNENQLMVQVKRSHKEEEEASSPLSSTPAQIAAISPDHTHFAKSNPLHCRPFAQNTCLAVGKRTKGLPLSLAALCDSFVHIPTFGLPGQDGWLTVEAGLSIVLHEFALWAGYGQQSHGGKCVHYQGQKYQVAKKQRGDPQGQLQKQQQRRDQRTQESVDEQFLENVFGGDSVGDY